MSPIYIHIGYPKAASTTLRKNLFDKHPDILNLGIFPNENIAQHTIQYSDTNNYLVDLELRGFHETLTLLDDFQYDQLDIQQLYNKLKKSYLSDKKGTIISNERFVSTKFSHNDIGSKAKRLKKIFPDAIIFIVLRNQIDFLISQYRDHPFDPRCFQIGAYYKLDEWIEILFNDSYNQLLESLKYDQVLDYYQQLFSDSNVGVFLLEEWKENDEKFALRLSDFMNISYEETLSCLRQKKQNSGVSHRFNLYRKYVRLLTKNIDINRILSENSKVKIKNNLKNFFKRGSKKKYSIGRKNLNLLKKYYASSNKVLEKKTGYDLKSFKYPL